MGSYRAIVVGPPDLVNELVSEVCEYIKKKDKVKNTRSFETVSIPKAKKIVKYEENFDGYPYLYRFSWEEIPDYLRTLEEQGYSEIVGEGIWFVCYNYSPEDELKKRKPDFVRYVIEDDTDGSTTPFSSDPAQDFKTDM
jgi:hypothetical protein